MNWATIAMPKPAPGSPLRCGTIGLHQLTGESKYADLMERTFLNNMLSSLSAEGDRHYYTNPLTTGGRERWHWPGHDCACCPSNLVRVISSISGYAYSHNDDTIFVNQYLASEGTVPLPDNPVTLIQTTRYPWDGDIALEVRPKTPGSFTIKLRIPGWARNQPMPGNLYKYVDIDDETSVEKITLAVNDVPMDVDIHAGVCRDPAQVASWRFRCDSICLCRSVVWLRTPKPWLTKGWSPSNEARSSTVPSSKTTRWMSPN